MTRFQILYLYEWMQGFGVAFCQNLETSEFKIFGMKNATFRNNYEALLESKAMIYV